MHIARHFTTAGRDPYENGAVSHRQQRDPQPRRGRSSSQAEGFEVPAEWEPGSLSDILAQKYFRKAGVPGRLAAGCGSRAFRPGCGGAPPMRRLLAALAESARHGGETSARQVFDRMAGTWTYWGWKGGYFDTEEDASAFLRRDPP